MLHIQSVSEVAVHSIVEPHNVTSNVGQCDHIGARIFVYPITPDFKATVHVSNV